MSRRYYVLSLIVFTTSFVFNLIVGFGNGWIGYAMMISIIIVIIFDIIMIIQITKEGAAQVLEEEGIKEDVSKHALVGTWIREGDVMSEYVFEADATGMRKTSDVIDKFEWLLLGDKNKAVRLTLNDIRGIGEQEIWMYTLEGDVLTMENVTGFKKTGLLEIFIRCENE